MKSEYDFLRFNIIDFLFTFIIFLCKEYFAHIIDFNKVTERDRPSFIMVEEWLNVIYESQLSSINYLNLSKQ